MLMLIVLLQETVAKCRGDGKTRGGKYHDGDDGGDSDRW